MNILAFSFSNILSIIIFIVLISIIVAWHELGHLLTAKKFNVYCYEYAIGFGPVIYKNKKHETYFALRAIPLGGFVKMAGEEGVQEGEILKDNNGNDIPNDRILSNKSLPKKALVLAAGGIMNLILALILFYFYVSFNDISNVTGKEKSTGFVMPIYTNEVTIADDSLLSNAGLETGDKVTVIVTWTEDEGEALSKVRIETNSYNDIYNALKSKEPTKVGQVQGFDVTYIDISDNNKEKTAYNITRTMVEEDGKKSISLIGISQYYTVHEYNMLSGLYGSFHYMGLYGYEVIKAFGKLFVGDISNLTGLVGIYRTVDSVTSNNQAAFKTKFIDIIYLGGALSFSLGFFNLIPFPALDGGRLFFVALEGIRKKKINPNVEAMIHFVGIIILFGLMIFINIRDIIGLFR